MRRNVELHVQGGMVTVVSRFPDVEVEIRDYDVPEMDDQGNPVSDCTVELYEVEAVQGPFCPLDGEPMRKLAEVGGLDTLTFYDCPSCDGWTYDTIQNAYIAGVPFWADELQKAIPEGNLPESIGLDGSLALYDR